MHRSHAPQLRCPNDRVRGQDCFRCVLILRFSYPVSVLRLWARDLFRAGWVYVLHAAVVLKGSCSRSGHDWKNDVQIASGDVPCVEEVSNTMGGFGWW